MTAAPNTPDTAREDLIKDAPKKVIEWVPGQWWVVAVTGRDGSYTPLHQGEGTTSTHRKDDCERYLREH